MSLMQLVYWKRRRSFSKLRKGIQRSHFQATYQSQVENLAEEISIENAELTGSSVAATSSFQRYYTTFQILNNFILIPSSLDEKRYGTMCNMFENPIPPTRSHEVVRLQKRVGSLCLANSDFEPTFKDYTFIAITVDEYAKDVSPRVLSSLQVLHHSRNDSSKSNSMRELQLYKIIGREWCVIVFEHSN